MSLCIDCKKQISKGHKRCKSCAVKGSFNPHFGKLGKDHPFFGRHHTKEHKQKMSSLKKFKHRPEFFGKSNPNWKGGLLSFNEIIRSTIEYEIWQTKIFKRDKGTCQNCGSTKNIETHHKTQICLLVKQLLRDHPELNKLISRPRLLQILREYKPLWYLKNGECLCELCHLLVKKSPKEPRQ